MENLNIIIPVMSIIALALTMAIPMYNTYIFYLNRKATEQSEETLMEGFLRYVTNYLKDNVSWGTKEQTIIIPIPYKYSCDITMLPDWKEPIFINKLKERLKKNFTFLNVKDATINNNYKGPYNVLIVDVYIKL